jgi:uncharacterized protein with von Willebrand factor type A (vWA) domain
VCAPIERGNVAAMNKKLESLIGRVTTWPQEAQDEAARALAEIEVAYVRARRPLTAEEEAKLADLRATINRSIERGGSYTDEEVAAYIERVHARAERKGR